MWGTAVSLLGQEICYFQAKYMPLSGKHASKFGVKLQQPPNLKLSRTLMVESYMLRSCWSNVRCLVLT